MTFIDWTMVGVAAATIVILIIGYRRPKPPVRDDIKRRIERDL